MTAEFSKDVLSTVHMRSDWCCEMCGRSRAAEHHHRIARGMGGTTRVYDAAGCLHLCRPCHRLAAELHRDLAVTNGWLIEHADEHTEPSSVPVVYRGERVLLDALGNLEAA